jgi:ribonuclease BN (tRNA processing enzyme)
MPTQSVVKVASGATLLIHEASMADDDLEAAQARAHSTVGQAIQIARKCVITLIGVWLCINSFHPPALAQRRRMFS